MSSSDELKKIAALAYLETEGNNLIEDVNSIMQYIEQLREIDTNHISPLQHPLDLAQRLRTDTITESNHVAALETIAPSFSNGLYQVPKVIDR